MAKPQLGGTFVVAGTLFLTNACQILPPEPAASARHGAFPREEDPAPPRVDDEAADRAHQKQLKARLQDCADIPMIECMAKAPELPGEPPDCAKYAFVYEGQPRWSRDASRSYAALLIEKHLRRVPNIGTAVAGNIHVTFSQVGDRAGIEARAARVKDLEVVKAVLAGLLGEAGRDAVPDAVLLSRACFREAGGHIADAITDADRQLTSARSVMVTMQQDKWLATREAACKASWNLTPCEEKADYLDDATRSRCRTACEPIPQLAAEGAYAAALDKCAKEAGQAAVAPGCSLSSPAGSLVRVEDRAGECSSKCVELGRSIATQRKEMDRAEKDAPAIVHSYKMCMLAVDSSRQARQYEAYDPGLYHTLMGKTNARCRAATRCDWIEKLDVAWCTFGR